MYSAVFLFIHFTANINFAKHLFKFIISTVIGSIFVIFTPSFIPGLHRRILQKIYGYNLSPMDSVGNIAATVEQLILNFILIIAFYAIVLIIFRRNQNKEKVGKSK
jgi:hypothetical protein